LQYTLGVQVSRAISLSHGVIVPQFDLGYSYESRNADFALTARLLGANASSQPFTVRADDPDKGFGNVGVGFVYVAANGRQAYLNYRRLFANDSLSRDTINLGARFEF
jgi:outer membrane lipase/esterase